MAKARAHNKIVDTSQAGIDLIKKYEGYRADAYKCPAGVWTIGYGTTIYPNGRKVRAGDSTTKSQSEQFLRHDLRAFEIAVDRYTTDRINQNQFDALVSFAYNLGSGALRKSTLLKKVNYNPNDPSIKREFAKWVYAGGRKLKGLQRRRTEEAHLYFS